MDMSRFIVAKSDQLNADDLMGGPITVTIERVTGNDSADQPVSVHYVGCNGKPYKPCKSMRRVMVAVWGMDASKYAGRAMTLRRDPDVQFGGMKLGGIRISHMSGLDSERALALNVTRGKKALYKVLPLAETAVDEDGPRDAFGLAPVTEGPAKAGQTRDEATEEWARKYIAKVQECPTIDALMALQARWSDNLASLKEARADLHDLAVEAGSTRAAELQRADA